ncbi:NAD(P)/FAD-dependent oxidoreductase [Arthrobacter sp. QXT-31]|uniref:NAD(P)/FAD-dependent oxidoreductase n=1 Tax=Arthrobacter sp. QXT-31 TaxID=1357915 RepID=UPI001F290351|nr:NAD(P)/FAD-dependent oxidoreductase [Arthrobacter sp. QXT-31]
MAPEKIYDVVVVGGGAAGLSAAVTLSRALRSVVVIDAGEPRNGRSPEVHGFLAHEGLPPGELLAAGRTEVRAYGGEILQGRAVSARKEAGIFITELQDRRSLRSRRLLIASGFEDELPEVTGINKRWGRDVLHCPYCHGWEIRDRAIGILATEPAAVQEALLFRQWSGNVTFFQHLLEDLDSGDREQLEARSIRVVKGRVAALEISQDTLRGLRVASGQSVACDYLVVKPTARTESPVLQSLGLQQADGAAQGRHLGADPNGLTTAAGVWAAGNICDPTAEVITAASAGVKAATAINADLVDEDTRLAVEAAKRAAFPPAVLS